MTVLVFALRFGVQWEDITSMDRIIFGDYMIPGAEPRIYEQVMKLLPLLLPLLPLVLLYMCILLLLASFHLCTVIDPFSCYLPCH